MYTYITNKVENCIWKITIAREHRVVILTEIGCFLSALLCLCDLNKHAEKGVEGTLLAGDRVHILIFERKNVKRLRNWNVKNLNYNCQEMVAGIQWNKRNCVEYSFSLRESRISTNSGSNSHLSLTLDFPASAHSFSSFQHSSRHPSHPSPKSFNSIFTCLWGQSGSSL